MVTQHFITCYSNIGRKALQVEIQRHVTLVSNLSLTFTEMWMNQPSQKL